MRMMYVFFLQAEDGIRDYKVTGVQTCALPIFRPAVPFGIAVARQFQPWVQLQRLAFLGIGLLSCAGRWRRSRARSGLLQRECVFLALGRLRMLPEIAVVITVDAGHGMVLRVHAHAHLSQVVGQDGGNGPECGVVLQPVPRGGVLEQVTGLVDPVVAVHALWPQRSEEHTSELQSPCNLVCRLLLEKKKKENDVSVASS